MRSAMSKERNKLTTLCRGTDVGHALTPYRQRIWMPTKSMRPYSVASYCNPCAIVKPTQSLNTGDKAQKSKAFIWMPAAAAVTGWPLTLCHHIVGRNAVRGNDAKQPNTKQKIEARGRPDLAGYAGAGIQEKHRKTMDAYQR